eukprot:3604971-Lingulodinium_polyedra.AAC.1
MGGKTTLARALRRMPEPQQWCLDSLKEIKVTPWRLRVDDALAPVVRRKYITEARVEKYGRT